MAEINRDFEALFGLIANTAIDGYWIIDADTGRIKFANDKTCSMYGYSCEEMLERGLSDFEAAMSPDEIASINANIRQCGYARFETSHYRKGGDQFPVEVSVAYFPQANELHAFQRDLTERNLQRLITAENERRYKALVDLTQDGVMVIVEETRKIIDCNEQICRQLGYTREELLALEITDIDLASEGEPAADEIRKLRETGSNFFETTHRTKNGDFINVLVKAQSISLSGTRVFQSICRDITSQRKKEEMLSARFGLEEFSFTHTLDELLVETLNVLERLTNSRIGFFHFLDEDQKTLTLHAWSTSTTREYCKAEGAGSHYDIADAGIWVDCIRERRAIVHNDYAAVKNKRGLPEGHAALVRELVVPIFRGDKIKAIVGIGNKPLDYNGFDVETVLFFANLAWEIAERMLAEESLKASEEQLRCITDAVHDGIVMMDAEGLIRYWSPATEAIFGYSREEVIGKDLHHLLAPARYKDEQAEAMAFFRNTGTGKAIGATVELGALRKDNSEIVIELSLSSLKIRDAWHAVGVIRDVTERKKADEELKNSLLFNKSVIDSAEEGIVVLDKELKFQKFNKYMEKLTGFSEADLVGLHPADAFPFLVDVGGIEDYKRTLGGETVSSVEFPYSIPATGKYGWVVVSYAPIFDVNGKVIGAMSLVRDITEAKKTAERLLQSEKMEAVGTLAGGIAHDFNNILSSIIGYTELAMTDEKLDDELRQYLGEVLSASDRAKELVKQILAFSRKKEKNKLPVDVSRISQEVLKLMKAVIPKNIVIDAEIMPNAGYVMGDPTEIHQIMMNLCTNAYQSMADKEAGTLRIRVGSRKITKGECQAGIAPEAGDYVSMAVEDTGAGIGEATLKRIFEPYFTTKGLGQGTGLGLSTVHGLVSEMKGAINVESKVGAGTSFKILLPLHRQAQIEQEWVARQQVMNFKGNILFVDDEPQLARLGKRMLEMSGFTVKAVADPLEALEIFQRTPYDFDILLTDQTMPGITGTELIRRAKIIRNSLPAVICTGYSDLVDEARAAQQGIDAFIPKPFEKDKLVGVICSIMQRLGK